MSNQIYSNPDNPNKNNEEVDLIKLLNYFKNGIKSFFKAIGKFFELIIQFIILLKKNWMILFGLTLFGAVYGWYTNFSGVATKKYEMVVKSSTTSNLELYSFSNEVNSVAHNLNHKGEGITLVKKLGITRMDVEPVKRTEDVINNYFEQIDATSFRGDATDTLYYQAYDIDNHKDNMDKIDYTLQKIKFSIKNNTSPNQVQEQILDYMNNLPNVKRQQESKLGILVSYEKELKRNISNIDSLLSARTVANKKLSASGSEQVVLNTSTRNNVEPELLRFSEVFIRKLYGIQKMIADNQNSVSVVSDLRLTVNNDALNNPILKYALIGFILSTILVLMIQFNKYLEVYNKKKN